MHLLLLEGFQQPAHNIPGVPAHQQPLARAARDRADAAAAVVDPQRLQPGAAAQLAAASMIEADAAFRANISNTLMAMSADPTQDPGVVLRLYKCAAPPSSRARSAVAAR